MGNQKNKKKDTIINIITGSRISRIRADDIEAIEQEGRKLHIMTGKEDFACYASIDGICDELLSIGCFYQPMKKLLINFDKVIDIMDNEIYFVSGASLIMGRNKVSELRRAFKEYLYGYSNTVIGGPVWCVSEGKNNSTD